AHPYPDPATADPTHRAPPGRAPTRRRRAGDPGRGRRRVASSERKELVDVRPDHARHRLAEVGGAVALGRRVVEQAELHPRLALDERAVRALVLELVHGEPGDVVLAVAPDRVWVAVPPAGGNAAEAAALAGDRRVLGAGGVLL